MRVLFLKLNGMMTMKVVMMQSVITRTLLMMLVKTNQVKV
jgi:hypothetical protein